jgi:uncharacterized Zn finger protein
MSASTEFDAIPPLLEPVTNCPNCGSCEVFAAIAPPGERERAVYLRCRECGRERPDLEFYEA